MALTYPVSAFLDAIRKRTDNEGASALDRFDNDEVLGYLNRAVWAFWRIMVESRGGNFQVGTTTVSTESGRSIYPLAATFYRLLNVNATIDGRSQWLVPFDENERAMLSDPSVGWSGRPFRYALVGSNIEFLPAPNGVFSVEVRFVPDPPTLTELNSFDCVNADGMNFIIDAAAKLMAEKDENFDLATAIGMEMAELKASLQTSLPNRDQNFPPRIQDVSHARGGAGGLRMRRRGGRW